MATCLLTALTQPTPRQFRANSNQASGGTASITDISASTVTLNASNLGSGGFTVDTNAGLTVSGAVSAGTVSLNAGQNNVVGNLTVNNTISSNQTGGITLTTGTSAGASGAVTVNSALNSSDTITISTGDATGAAAGSVALNASLTAGTTASISTGTGTSGGNITQLSGQLVSAPTVVLQAQEGNIGVPAGSAIDISASSLTANAVTGSVNVSDNQSVALVLLAPAPSTTAAGGSYAVTTTAGGSITTTDTVNAGTNLTLTAAGAIVVDNSHYRHQLRHPRLRHRYLRLRWRLCRQCSRSSQSLRYHRQHLASPRYGPPA